MAVAARLEVAPLHKPLPSVLSAPSAVNYVVLGSGYIRSDTNGMTVISFALWPAFGSDSYR